MIRYALACAKGHAFESWFQNSAAYDKQRARGLVGCPVCGDTKIEKAVMSPRLSGAKNHGHTAPPPTEAPAPASAAPAQASSEAKEKVSNKPSD